MSAQYPRDLIGYGANPPHPRWPGGARLALQIVMNYEEGGENSVLHGDAGSEAFLSEIINAEPVLGARHMSMESIYEYGSRAGVWRLLRLFDKYQVPVTVFAVASALERYPAIVAPLLKAGHEICSHGYKWINYQRIDEATERAHVAKAVEVIKALTGEAPVPIRGGWWSSMAAFSTTPTTTMTTCLFG